MRGGLFRRQSDGPPTHGEVDVTEPARGSGPGCLTWLVALLGLGALTGAVLWFTVLNGDDDQPPTTSSTGPTATSTSTIAAPDCTDATEEFRSSAAGPGIEFVRGVCWESGGQLRVEVELADDVNVDSAPMQGLCMALTDYITASGRPWQGFTAYSSSPLTPGQALLARAQPDQPCQNPSQG
jgi:hypothetical protein